MRRIAALVLTALSLAGAPATAQQAKADPAAASVDPALTKAVHGIFDAMNYRDVVKKFLAEMTRNMPAMLMTRATARVNADTSLNAEQKKAELEATARSIPETVALMEREFADPTLVDEMLGEMVPLYARHFSVAEAEQIAAFYRTPAGKRIMTVTPQILSEGMQIGQRIMRPRVQRILEQVAKGK